MFDKVFNRKNSGSYKWDTTVPEGLIERGAYPLSVADMEFQTPEEVREAIKDFTDKKRIANLPIAESSRNFFKYNNRI